jgi:GntR family transcriptional regulator, transcriptional repressor for pyruvate dehydrogenase complex
MTQQRRPDAVELTGIGPVSTARRADSVAEQIRNLIISEQIGAGARLPPERELALRFEASRPTVSQALRSLSLMGLVEIRHGSGAYVVRRPEVMVAASVNLMLDLDTESVGQLLQLRLWLETIGVREAALAGPDAGGIEVALGRLHDAAGSTSELVAADTVFHATVVRGAGNQYLASIYESVHSAVLSYQLKGWVDSESVPPWLRGPGPAQHWQLHEPIATAVLARDAQAAEAAVLAHHNAMVGHFSKG